MPTYKPEHFWNDLLTQSFDRVGTGHGGYGRRYNEFLYRAKERALRRVLRRNAVSLVGRSVIDVGCGTGFLRSLAMELGCGTYTGIDIAGVSIAQLRMAFPGDRFSQADIGSSQLPPEFESKTFDLVVCLDVLYHLVEPAAFAQAQANLWRLVAPGGHLLLADSFWRTDVVPHVRVGDIAHVVFHKRADYERNLFRQPDFELRDVQPMYYLFNRPMVGGRFPWTWPRLSWQIRHRLLESKAVLSCMFWLDGLLVSVVPPNPSLKLLVARKRAVPASHR